MADGNITTDDIDINVDEEELPRDGIHFLKRARSRVLPLHQRRLDIFRSEFRPVNGKARYQVIQVGTTATADVEEAEAALKRFVLTDIEAKLAQKKFDVEGGKPPARDMRCSEVFVEYMLSKGEGNTNADSFRRAIVDARRAWPDDPRVSTIDRTQQKEFVKVHRKLKVKPWHAPGEPEAKDEYLATEEPNDSPNRHYKDGSIATRLQLIFAMFRWAHAESKQTIVPGKIRDDEWQPIVEVEERAYTDEEVMALLNAAGKPEARSRLGNTEVRRPRRNEVFWRGMMNYLNWAARGECGNTIQWVQVKLEENEIELNPPGRRRTRKRRPTLPLTPTYRAEFERWLVSEERHPQFVCSHRGKARVRHVWFETLKRRAGITYGTVKTLRKTVRTMFDRYHVPARVADRWCGWVEEEAGASRTGRMFYNRAGIDWDMQRYFEPCIKALEAWFDDLQRGVDYPLGNRQPRGMRAPGAYSFRFNSLLGNCVTTDLGNLLSAKEMCAI